MGGRFGKYGDFKRKQNLRKGRSITRGLTKGLKKIPKILPKPTLIEPEKEK